jgi:hypothetical protein
LTLSLVTITCTDEDGTLGGLSGTVQFTPSSTIQVESVPAVIADVPVQAEITNGQLLGLDGQAVQLLPTDTANVTIENGDGFWFWTVCVTINGPDGPLPPDTWRFQLPSSPTSVDLYSTRG